VGNQPLLENSSFALRGLWASAGQAGSGACYAQAAAQCDRCCIVC